MIAEAPAERPLSLGQEALWFLETLQPGGSAYNIGGAARFDRPLDGRALAIAWDRLRERHEALRISFVRTPAGPAQRVAPLDSARLPLVIDERREPLSEGALPGRLAELGARPFDLGQHPLVRVTLLRTTGGADVLHLCAHHLVADLWSVGLLWNELSTLYAELTGAAPPSEPPVPASRFSDQGERERRRLAGEEGERLWRWWRDELAAAPLTLDLPTDLPPPPLQSLRGALLTRTLPPALAGRLEAFAAASRGTPYTVLLAAWSAVLSHWSGQEELLVGTPTPGRHDPETAGVVGYFVNPLVLRADLHGNPSFAELCRRLRRRAIGAFRHQDLPFPRLVERLAQERRAAHDPSRPPVVQAMLSWQQAPRELPPGLAAFALELDGAPIALGPLAGRSVAFARRGAQFDLALLLAPVGGEIVAALEYSTALFERSTAARLLEHFETLLAAGLERPERPWRELPWLGPVERAQVLERWSIGPPLPASDLLLHQLFERRAALEGDAEALLYERPSGLESWSYRELAERASRLAGRLVALGVGPEVRVAVSLPREPTLVAALLAVLEAGGAYVPIDPSYPAERRALMLADSGARVLLARAETTSVPDGIVIVDPDSVESEGGTAGPLSPPGTSAGPEALAYVLFTSGSTGRPKGVALTHRSAVAFLTWALDTYSRDELTGVLAATSISFDLSIFELFATLAAGGTVILAENALALPRLAARERVTLLNTVPSAARELLATGGIPSSVKVINLAGEALPGELVRRLYAETAVEAVWNLYGPTEDTTYSTAARIARDAPGEPVIGRPLTGGRAHVVGRDGRPLGIHIPGELVLGGAGLARGYLGRPGWTAERFVPDALGGEPGARLYHTGDLARFRPASDGGGELEYLGRIDQQVKVRGFRIELGEIEAVLRSVPGVASAAVVAREGAGGKLLAGYLAFHAGVAGDVEEVAAFLGARLPAYMVPAAWRVLSELPLNANGKIDRRALAALAPERAPAGRAVLRTTTERRLAALWCELLGLEQAGADDDFFRLGGHSLSIARLGARLPGVFGVDLPLAELLQRPTLAAQAARLDELGASGATTTAPIPRVPRAGPLPLTSSQGRVWLLDQLEPGGAAYNLAGGLRLEGELAPRALAAALAETTRRHEALRSVFPVLDGAVRQLIEKTRAELPVVDLGRLGPRAGAAMRRLGARAARTPFDLARGPLFRTFLLRLGPREHALLFVLHHIVADGWSLAVLREELAALYAAALAHPGNSLAGTLPEPAVQLGDFAVWQRERLSSTWLEGELRLWRERLAGAPLVLELPLDRPRRAGAPALGRELPIAWGAPRAEALRAFARAEATTPFAVLLAAFAAVLARTSGQAELLLGTAGAQRPRPELERTIGFFASTLVLRLDTARARTFRDLLAAARESAFFAFAHQEVPFERLVEELAPERDLTRSPLVQAVLVLQEDALRREPAAWPGLAAHPLRFHTGTSKFDLTLDLALTESGLTGGLEYRADLFDATTLERLEGRLARLLDAALAAPERALAELPLLSPAERQQTIVEWNDTTTAFPRALTIHGAVDETAAACPEAIAVVAGEEAVSYAELVARSRSLAARLAALLPAREREVPIALAVERSAAMPVALLALLRAGGAYVPVDPRHPVAHATSIFEDAGVRLLLTEERFRPRFEGWAEASGVPLIALDGGGDERARVEGDARHWFSLNSRRRVAAPKALPERAEQVQTEPVPEAAVAAEELAYVLFTSGSTGRPKGVEVSHRAVLRLVRKTSYLAFSPNDVFLQLAPLAFDASTLELWGPLANGARLEIFPPHTPTFDELAAFLAERRVSTLWLTAGLFHPLVELFADRLGGLADLLSGGDVLAMPRVLEARRALGAGRMTNGYGPTESTTFTTCYRAGADLAERGTVPIGRPIANTTVYIVDEGLGALPIGVPGELVIGGEGLARGYRHRPRLTADRFVPDPFSAEPGARLYRTGDRARLLADGNVEFLGRLDFQVKIRGFRVEPGEAEALLASLPGVRQAFVMVREDRPGEKRLVAYVVTEVAAESLREELRRRLPEYLVPAVIVALAELPVNANGKVDRRALPAPESTGPDSEAPAAVEQPEGELEQRLAALWRELLGREVVGRRENFFDLGGHSLLAARLATRVRESFRLELPLAALFEAPTVAELAAEIARRQGELSVVEEEIPLLPRPKGETFTAPLSPGQERLWFLEQLDPDQATYNLGAAFAVSGELDVRALRRALAAVVARHEVLRTAFVAVGGEPLQRVYPARGMGPGGRSLGSLGELVRRERRTSSQEPSPAPPRPWPASPGPPVDFDEGATAVAQRGVPASPAPPVDSDEGGTVLPRRGVEVVGPDSLTPARGSGPSTSAGELLAAPPAATPEELPEGAAHARARASVASFATLRTLDLTAIPDADRGRIVDHLRRRDLLQPFELSTGPLLRLTVVRLGPGQSVLLASMHHLVSDGWSIGILARELAAFYAAEEAALPAMAVQVADVAAWQRARLAASREAELGWWRETLAGAPPLLALPFDRPRTAAPSFRGAGRPLRLSPAASAAVEAFARRHGATPFMVLFAAFATLLSRLSGERDLVIGTPTAGRGRRELEGLIGFFVNTLPLRLRIGREARFAEIVAAAREAELAALAHQDVPFAELVEALAPGRALGTTPLFQVLFVLQNAPAEPLSLPGLTLAPLPAVIEAVAFELTMGFEEKDGAFEGTLDYRRDLFDASTICRFTGAFERLLGAAITSDAPVAHLPLLAPSERQQLLREWNDTAVDFGTEWTVAELFLEQAERTPELEAVVSEEETLSYRELARRVEALAEELLGRGLEPEEIVAVCAEREAAAIVGLLAVLRAGGAYLPLDPAYPAERLELMLTDSGTRLVLTQPWFEERFAGRQELLAGVTRLALAGTAPGRATVPSQPDGAPGGAPLPDGEARGAERRRIAQRTYGGATVPSQPDGAPRPGLVDPDRLAYVIYTSGSTGVPKGVLVPHRGLTSVCLDLVRIWRLAPGSRHLTFNSLAFDASASNLYPVLLSGAAFVMHRRPDELTGADLERLVVARRISHLDIPPAYWTLWLEELTAERWAPLEPIVEQLNLGGDSAPLERVRRFAALTSGRVRIFGPYGPTEATVGSSCHLSHDGREVSPNATKLPIGRPFANVDLHLLDRALEPVPVGVTGMIYIGGAGITRGYHRRPGATAAVFLPHPASETPGARLYESGDLARWLPDGTLEFLGRRDSQLKLRGFRIELGEIEARLRAHPAVTEAVVIAHAGGGTTRLAAYVAASEPVSGAELAAFAAEGLPAYMVPSAIRVLEQLPVGPTGKIDRRALPAPDWGAATTAASEPPRGELERTVAAVWAEVLGGAAPGRDEDFFALGGHSLLATQVISRLRARLGIELPVRALFEAPTVAALAERVREARARGHAGEIAVPAVAPLPRTGPGPWALPMSFAQQRLWFLDQLAPGTPLYNLPGSFRLRGAFSPRAFLAAARAVVARHEILRTTYRLESGEPVQWIEPLAAAGRLRVPVVDLSRLRDDDAEGLLTRLAAREAAAPFDLAGGPLLRLRLLRRSPLDNAVLVTMHHIASDGWSMSVFSRELGALYLAEIGGAGDQALPPLPLQYADYAGWQRETLAGERLERELAHWRGQLAGAPVILELPADRPRPPMQSSAGAVHEFRLGPELSRHVREAAIAAGATPYMLLLAAFQALLGRLTGRTDLLVGVGVANRPSAELEGLIGFFVNTLPVRARLAGNPRLGELVEAARLAAFDTFAHQEMPFDKLVDALELPRDLSRPPLVQVAFVLQNLPAPASELGGARIEGLGFEVTTAKFDLLLALIEEEGGEIAGVVEYASDLYDAATIARWMKAFRELVAAFTGTPETRLAAVPLFVTELAAAIGRREGEIAELAPATPTQRDLYLDHLLAPESTLYSLGLSVPLDGLVNDEDEAARWSAALTAVAAREPALNVRFAALVGEPYQLRLRAGDAHPVRRLDAADPGALQTLEQLVAREIKRPYELARDGLARHFLFRDRAGRYTAVLGVHHIVCDAFSGRLFFERVARELRRGGDDAGGSFFEWAGESGAVFDVAGAEAFWRERLARVEALAAEGAAPAGTASPARASLTGPALETLRALAARHGLSAAAVLRTLYAALLARLFDGDGDVLLQDVVSGRPRGHEGTIGCFYQVVPAVFRRRALTRGAIGALLESARDERRALGANRNLSLLLQRQILRQGGLRFHFNYYHFARVALAEGVTAPLAVHDSFPPDEPHLIASDQEASIELALHFDPARFAGFALPARLAGLLEQIESGGDELERLEVLLPGERARILAWNHTALPAPLEAGDLARLLTAEAERSAERVALRSLGEELTYRELHRRATALAAFLRERGIGPESQVGVFLERSTEMVVALLGIVHAGGAYLPLDPHHPADRLAFQLEDSRVTIVLTHSSLLERLAAARSPNTLTVPSARRDLTVFPLDSLVLTAPASYSPPTLDPEHPVYVIYTSGSTGKPKGAVNTHRALVNRLLWMQRAYSLDESDAVLQKTPYTFDVSVWEFFWPLLTGARLVMARPEGHKDPDYLVETIRAEGITTLHFVPSMLGLFVEADGLETLRSPRRVIASGEALPAELVRRFHGRFGGRVELHNLYGPTEAAIDVTSWSCSPEELSSSVPIGRPIDNLRTLVLDRAMRLLPPLAPGELFLGGAGLARGYHRRPGLTAERFVPDPHAENGGERLYRTGDLTRQRADGALEYLGRLDHQVKIRGVRIELGEIEAALLSHLAVAAAVVVARADAGPESARLVAYITAAEHEAPTVEELRRFLARALPEAMVPAAVVTLPSLPLSPNGKIDRKALPAPEAARPELERHFVAPRSELERAVAGLWREALAGVLGKTEVGVEDNFFDLGGNSLSLARAHAGLKGRFPSAGLSLVELFQRPTVAAVAALLAERGAGGAEAPAETAPAETAKSTSESARDRAALRLKAAEARRRPR